MLKLVFNEYGFGYYYLTDVFSNLWVPLFFVLISSAGLA